MPATIVVGTQWGDEGKGKLTDLVAKEMHAVVRYQGGHNAGHTVKFGDRHFALRLIPSGILHPTMRCVMGNGMVKNLLKHGFEVNAYTRTRAKALEALARPLPHYGGQSWLVFAGSKSVDRGTWPVSGVAVAIKESAPGR